MTSGGARATRRRQLRISPLWLVPFIAVLIGAWMGYQRFADRGPTVILRMPEAEGIEADKTLVKARNVEVGEVVDVRLSDDLGHTLVEARLRPGGERMLNEGTDFWVVKPRIGSEGISGLNTVLSGAYIALRPGDSDKPQRRFKVLESPPVTDSGEDGLRITLVGSPDDALQEGDPINYHGTTVGRVASVDFDTQARRITHTVFIRPKYRDLVRANTRFWVASGVDVTYEDDGFNARFESLETLLGGGISLGLPDDGNTGERVGREHRFEIHDSRQAAYDALFDRYLEYVVLVDDSVSGLAAGAGVRYRGVRLGTVARVAWRFDGPIAGAAHRRAIPVLIRIEPGRLVGSGETVDLDAWRERMEKLVAEGLHASIQSTSLITGSSHMTLTMREQPSSPSVADYEGHPVLPSASGGTAHIRQQVTDLLQKFNDLEVQRVLDQLESSAAGSRATFAAVEATAAELESLLADPATRALPGEIDATLAKLRRTLAGIDQDSALYHQLDTTLQRFDVILQDLKPLVRLLRENPNALIFGRERRRDPEPEASGR